MSVKQVKLNLKPEIYKPLAQEAKRLRMPIAALARAILADAVLSEQPEMPVEFMSEQLAEGYQPAENKSPVDMQLQAGKFQGEQQTEAPGQPQGQPQVQLPGQPQVLGKEDGLLFAVVESLVDSANSLASSTQLLADSVREISSKVENQVSTTSLAQAQIPQTSTRPQRQTRLDKDGELVLKLSDLLAQEVASQDLTKGLTQDVIVEDLNAPAESSQKLRKITINL